MKIVAKTNPRYSLTMRIVAKMYPQYNLAMIFTCQNVPLVQFGYDFYAKT